MIRPGACAEPFVRVRNSVEFHLKNRLTHEIVSHRTLEVTFGIERGFVQSKGSLHLLRYRIENRDDRVRSRSYEFKRRHLRKSVNERGLVARFQIDNGDISNVRPFVKFVAHERTAGKFKRDRSFLISQPSPQKPNVQFFQLCKK